MKKNIPYLIFIALILGQFLISCKRQELVEPSNGKVVNLKITGTTLDTEQLEFVKNGKVIGESIKSATSYDVNTKITLEEPTAEIQVRRKSDQVVIATKTVTSKFNQTLTCYYDGREVYDTMVKLEIKGYSGEEELEFTLDDELVGIGQGTDFPELTVVLNKDKKRQVQIRKKGDPQILLDYEVLANVPVQKLVFYYDGVQLLDKIELGTPQNPANMLFSASFKSTVDVFSGPVDLVFCKGSIHSDTFDFTIKITDPRIELSSDGSFSKNFELPALTAQDIEDKLKYGVRLVKRGTVSDIPYDLTKELKPIFANKSSVYNSSIEVIGGTGMLLVLTDKKTAYSTGPSSRRGTTFPLNGVDISAYFKP